MSERWYCPGRTVEVPSWVLWGAPAAPASACVLSLMKATSLVATDVTIASSALAIDAAAEGSEDEAASMSSCTEVVGDSSLSFRGNVVMDSQVRKRIASELQGQGRWPIQSGLRKHT